MPQFLIIARDGTDADAPARRQAARAAHLESIGPHVTAGNIVVGGAILDEEGTMRGSVIIAEFPSRAALDAWMRDDPYVRQKVWQSIEVQPFRVAVRGPVS